MAVVDLKYGYDTRTLEISDINLLGILDSDHSAGEASEEEIIAAALRNPINSAPLGKIVNPGNSICIIIPDITRLWQKPFIYLPLLIEELNEAGIADEDILLLSALGSHRKQSFEEHKMLMGEELSKRFKVVDHDCRDESNLVGIGTTSFGTVVRINGLAAECDHIIMTGGIVFHDLAGFGGGRKSILPGISAYDTIMANHSLSLAKVRGEGTNPLVRSGNCLDNPFHLDMIEATRFAAPAFLLNVITDSEGRISRAVAGHYETAHQEGCSILKNIDSIEIDSKADIVIVSSGGYPKDIDLYQASKALSNAQYCAKEGGTIILLAECSEGLGHPEMEFMLQKLSDNKEREDELRSNYTIAKYTAYLLCSLSEKYNVLLLSSLDQELLGNSKIKCMKSLEEALDSVSTGDKKIYAMKNGAITLPIDKIL